MRKPKHIVFTTIYHPLVLNDLFENISRFGHLDETKVWVVGDRKTPESARTLSEEVTRKGLEVVFLGMREQEEIGQVYPEFYERIPFNNETRRNLGYLKALEDGCEILISIDDDNFPIVRDDFVGRHSATGGEWLGDLIYEPTGFHNICEHIIFKPTRSVYPRGFPFRLRGQHSNRHELKSGKDVRIGVTAGLWLAEPDIDATTWLNGKVSGVGYRGEDISVLAEGVWTPINTQNTSVARELIPAYLCIPMGWDVPGGKINRYGDIWGGYFLQALMAGTNYRAAFGRPLVEHRRNPHDYIDDLRHEYWGTMLTDWLLEALKTKFIPKSSVMTEKVIELANFLDDETKDGLPAWCPQEMRAFLVATAESMRRWSYACEKAARAYHFAILSPALL